MLNYYFELILIPSLALTVGMLAAFFATMKGKKGHQRLRKQSMLELLRYAYLVGNLYCIVSFILLMSILAIIFRVPLENALGKIILGTFFTATLSLFIGIILYLPCALLGYNFYARKIAEKEIAKTQRQILKEIETEKSSELESV